VNVSSLVSRIVAGGLLVCAGSLSLAQVANAPFAGPTPVVDAVPSDAPPPPFNPFLVDEDIAPPNHPPLDQIPPMPMAHPESSLFPIASDSIIFYDAETGEMREIPLGDPAFGPGSGVGGSPFTGDGPVDFGHEMARGFGTMSAVADSTLETYPARANVRLAMRFIDQGGNTRFFSCSGSMADAGVVLTAAHCIYARSPNGINIFDFAEEVWVYPGWDGVGNTSPPGTTEVHQKFGWARGTQYIAGSAYVDSGNWDRDAGAIRLSRTNTRQVGMLTGTYGWSYGTCSTNTSHFNYSYPAESCSATRHTGRQMYFWSGTPDGCPGLFDNQFNLTTTAGCFTAVWGGMSGSAMYRVSDGNRYVAAVCSTSNRSTAAAYCALWEQFTTDLETFKTNTRGSTFDLEALRFRFNTATTLRQGDSFTSNFLASNVTNANPASNTYTFRVYLSTNNDISSSDTLLATRTFTWDYAPMQNVTINVGNIQIPYSVSPGNYWVGVVLDSGTDGNSSNNDTDTWDAQPITVQACLAPAAPTNLQATPTCSNIVLTWNAASGATSYRVYRHTSNSSGSATHIASPATNSFTDNTAALGTTYYYWVRTQSDCSLSGYSTVSSTSRLTVPAAPTGLSTFGSGCSGVQLTWNSTPGATSYRVYRSLSNSSGTATLIASPGTNSYLDSAATANVLYYYWVRANNSCGLGNYSASVTGSRTSTPGAPGNLQASDGTNCDGITVTWTSGFMATSYTVFRDSPQSPGIPAVLASTSNLSYTDLTAIPAFPYRYWVRASNSCGNGGSVGPDTGYRQYPPGAPSNLAASDGTSCTTITLTWNSGSNAQTYRILRGTTASVNDAVVLANNVVGNIYQDNTGVVGATYYYWINSANNCYASALVGPDTGFRQGPPVAPTNVRASDGRNCNSVSISWTASPNATNYRIFRNTVNSPIGMTLLGLKNSSPYSDTTTVGDTVYWYWVQAISPCGTSPVSLSDSGFAGTSAVFDLEPEDQYVVVGGTATFTVEAAGASGFTWRRNGIQLSDGPNVSGSTTNTLEIYGVTEDDDGDLFQCFITSPCGNAFSNRASLFVLPVPCPADFNQDGGIDGADVQAFFDAWEQGDPSADVNYDGGVDGEDVDYFFAAWENGGC
jgi:fibronectin type 3 domain-containing protein